jgi:hypothetical protein
MSWKEDNSLKRIFNTFKRLKVNIFKEDIEALKTINERLENYKLEYVNDNLLFAKLLSIQIRQNLSIYENLDISLKKVDEDLKQPLEYHLKFLRSSLNHIEYNNFLESLGMKTQFFTTRKEVEENNKIIEEHQTEISKKFINGWSYEKIEKSFMNTANDLLKDINNYK